MMGNKEKYRGSGEKGSKEEVRGFWSDGKMRNCVLETFMWPAL